VTADASIYGNIKAPTPVADPLESYAKVQNLRSLMGQNQLQDLQRTKLTNDMAEEDAYKNVLRQNQGGTLESLLPQLRTASPDRALKLEGTLLDQKVKGATLAHTTAQTSEINGGHIAAVWAGLAKGNGSDQSVKEGEQMLVPYIGAEAAAAASQKLLALPPSQRLAYAVSQAGQHKVGQDALKIFFPAAHMTDTGGAIVPTSTSTLPGGPAPGAPIPGAQTIAKTNSPDAILHSQTAMRGQNMADARAREANGIMADGGISPESEQMAQAIAAGKLPPLSGFALNRPGGRAVMGRVMQLNPEYNGQDYAVGLKAEKDFATGKQGNAVRSFNVSLSHLDSLEKLSDALQNGDMRMVNQIGNFVATQTGKPAPTDFNAAKKIVGDEIVKAIVGGGGGVADREQAAKVLDAANSPAQLKGVINTYKDLMRGQLKGLRQQYEASGGRNFDRYLSPAGKANEAGSGPVHIGGDDEYNKLSKGTQYVGPDGVMRVK